jgi:hypothetical protein
MACLRSLFMHIHILKHVEFFALHFFFCYLRNFCFAYAYAPH